MTITWEQDEFEAGVLPNLKLLVGNN